MVSIKLPATGFDSLSCLHAWSSSVSVQPAAVLYGPVYRVDHLTKQDIL